MPGYHSGTPPAPSAQTCHRPDSNLSPTCKRTPPRPSKTQCSCTTAPRAVHRQRPARGEWTSSGPHRPWSAGRYTKCLTNQPPHKQGDSTEYKGGERVRKAGSNCGHHPTARNKHGACFSQTKDPRTKIESEASGTPHAATRVCDGETRGRGQSMKTHPSTKLADARKSFSLPMPAGVSRSVKEGILPTGTIEETSSHNCSCQWDVGRRET